MPKHSDAIKIRSNQFNAIFWILRKASETIF